MDPENVSFSNGLISLKGNTVFIVVLIDEAVASQDITARIVS